MSRKYFLLPFFMSLLFHGASFFKLGGMYDVMLQQDKAYKKTSVPFKITYTDKHKKQTEDDKEHKRILETKQTETAAPKEASYLGETNHQAKEEMAPLDQKIRPPGADIGRSPSASGKAEEKQKSQKSKQEKKLQALTSIKPPSIDGPLIQVHPKKSMADQQQEKPRNGYENLLQVSMNSMDKEVDKGYQEYLDDKIRLGKSLDLNTHQYKFISYFSKIRKAIELAWVYPAQAARQGIDGKVLVSFTINKKGRVTRVEVKDSSGNNHLDNAIVNAIQHASPFAPLPSSMAENQLDVTGTFSYILRSY